MVCCDSRPAAHLTIPSHENRRWVPTWVCTHQWRKAAPWAPAGHTGRHSPPASFIRPPRPPTTFSVTRRQKRKGTWKHECYARSRYLSRRFKGEPAAARPNIGPSWRSGRSCRKRPKIAILILHRQDVRSVETALSQGGLSSLSRRPLCAALSNYALR